MTTTLDVLQAFERDARAYRLLAMKSVARSSHMKQASGSKIGQPDIDGLLVDFINFIAAQRGVDYALKTGDLGGEPEAAVSPDAPVHPYSCPLCGTRLYEIGMGLLGCRECHQDFIPMCNTEQGEYGLSWFKSH